jgi:hypothetical protein
MQLVRLASMAVRQHTHDCCSVEFVVEVRGGILESTWNGRPTERVLRDAPALNCSETAYFGKRNRRSLGES